MASSGHVAFYPAFAQIEGRGAQLCQFNLLVNLLGKGASYPT